MKISVFGLGYVGCVSIGCLAQNGCHVIGVDVNSSKTESINMGKCPIVEKDIDNIISEQYKLGKITATQDSSYAINETDVSFICVGTPSTSNGHLNLDSIFKVAEQIGKALKSKLSFHIIVIRSTVLPGTNAKVSKLIERTSNLSNEKDFAVVSNPEFLREGSAVLDYYSPPYTLIGSSNKKAISSLKSIYSAIDAQFIVTDIKTAELIKYVNNAFHAIKITFANEVGNICKSLDINSHKLMNIFCSDKKLNISSYYLKPGFAYGGSCLPKDLKALKTIAHDFYLNVPLIDSIERSNENQKNMILNQLIELKKQKIGFFGLSFKPGTDDLRNSPIVDIIERLIGKGFDIKIYDKNVHFSQLMGANKEYILKKIPYISKLITNNPRNVTNHSEVIVIVHNSPEFSKLLNDISRNTIILDLANLDFYEKKYKSNYTGVAW